MQAGLVLHLLPAYPLDCGRLIRGSFARTHGLAPAGRAATGLGQVLALAAMVGGMLLHSPWLIIAGFFIMIGAQIEDQGVFFQSVVDTVRMREVMLTDFATLSPSDTLADALARCVHSLQEDFPVVRGPQLVGIVSRQRIVDALRSDGNGYVQSVMSRAFQVARPEDTLGTTIRRITAGRGLVTDTRHRERARGGNRERAEPDEFDDPAGRAETAAAGRCPGIEGQFQVSDRLMLYQSWVPQVRRVSVRGPHGQVFVRGVIERLTWDTTKLDRNKFIRSATECPESEARILITLSS